MCEEEDDSAETIQRILTIIRIGTEEEEQSQQAECDDSEPRKETGREEKESVLIDSSCV